MEKKDLWLRLKHYHFDHIVPPRMLDRVTSMFGATDPSTQAFASKLSRKLGWSTRFACRSIEEYKKFLYLGVAHEMGVTPSRVIDQVWHEHILFTRPYREFCGEVLGRDFDHNPELVPQDDQTETFQAQYLDTLSAYRHEFRVEPPADIWAVPKFQRRAAAQGAQQEEDERRRASMWVDDTPLYAYFGDGGTGGPDGGHPEFGGGGGFGGGGSDRSWSDDGGHHDASDSGGGDGAGGGDSSGSDSGGDGGGSGCSSSCGGGCSS
ncbi:MAG: hypothetical protein JWO05_2534 [Gemmatimonadetes bacterium]|nr:hypothetical protein [Gemmatimonadota bacterium]